MNNSIERIIGAFRKKFGEEIEGSGTWQDINTLLRQSLLSVRKATIQEAVACVPEERDLYSKDSMGRKQTSIKNTGFNTCRTQTLTALKALAEKDEVKRLLD